MNEEHEIGSFVSFTAKRYKQTIKLVGRVKEKRKNFGWTEYLLEEITAEPLWVRTPKHAE